MWRMFLVVTTTFPFLEPCGISYSSSTIVASLKVKPGRVCACMCECVCVEVMLKVMPGRVRVYMSECMCEGVVYGVLHVNELLSSGRRTQV